MALLAALAVSPPASAKDLLSLSRLLTPAYTAMNYAAVCASDPPWAQTQPAGGRGTAVQYAQHIKDEIISGLTHEEALAVVRLAADAARADAREHLRSSVIAGEATGKAARLNGWCERYANGFIGALIRNHDSDHETFLKQVAQAKL
ncbi:MAG: hypothetical protein K2Z80_05790 [Xanthobacteraceae bacterium]|nr:hypothetical protein [Xanthobacteraceae bacterium]